MTFYFENTNIHQVRNIPKPLLKSKMISFSFFLKKKEKQNKKNKNNVLEYIKWLEQLEEI